MIRGTLLIFSLNGYYLNSPQAAFLVLLIFRLCAELQVGS